MLCVPHKTISESAKKKINEQIQIKSTFFCYSGAVLSLTLVNWMCSYKKVLPSSVGTVKWKSGAVLALLLLSKVKKTPSCAGILLVD